jgi:hypothetical protein
MNYLRKAYEVQAYQHDGSEQSAQDLAAWVQDSGESAYFRNPLGSDGFRVFIVTDSGSQQVDPGDWLVFNGSIFVVWTAERFAECFTAIEAV